MRVLVTGSNGFIGRRLCRILDEHGHDLMPIVRSIPVGREVAIGNVGPSTNWRTVLDSRPNVVIHLAAQTQSIGHDKSSIDYLLGVNVEAALNLAQQAAAAGVKRFVFLSSAKVNGEGSLKDRPYHASDEPDPRDLYAVSKYKAEMGLRELASKTSMDVVIIRPPLVYGPDVKANFAALISCVARGIPLPLAALTHNRRSYIALDNLVDFIMTSLDHPAASNQTFLVSDGDDLSTADLVTRIGFAMKKKAFLFYVPIPLLKFGADFINKPQLYQRLCGTLQLDSAKTKEVLDWTPPLSLEEGLRRAMKVTVSDSLL